MLQIGNSIHENKGTLFQGIQFYKVRIETNGTCYQRNVSNITLNWFVQRCMIEKTTFRKRNLNFQSKEICCILRTTNSYLKTSLNLKLRTLLSKLGSRTYLINALFDFFFPSSFCSFTSFFHQQPTSHLLKTSRK